MAERPPARRGPLVMMAVFGAAFAFLVALLTAIVVGSKMRTAASPPDQDARDAWILVVAIAAMLLAAGVFGVVFRLGLWSHFRDGDDDGHGPRDHHS